MRNIELAGLVVAQARTWVGTPYLHQHMTKGRGVDCVGLIVQAGLAAGVLDWTKEAWEPFQVYSRTPNPRRMREALELFMRPCADPGDGDVGWFDWTGEDRPMHLAIRSTVQGRPYMIHAFAHAGRCVEHGFVDPWPRRVCSWWRYPGLEV